MGIGQINEVDIRLLRVFVAVVEAGGFAAAQATLNVAASTISNHMSALEQRLGVKLCQRGRIGFRLTDKGRLVYEAACRLLAATEAFRSEAAQLHGQLVGDLRLGLVDNTVTDPASPVLPALRRFGAREHRVHLHVGIEAPQDLERRLLDGSLDIAIGSFPTRVSGLEYEPLYTERQHFYCGAGHPLFTAAEVTVEAVRACRIVARGYWHQNDLRRIGLPLSSAAATVQNMEAQAMLILSGGYLGYLPTHYAAPWVVAGQLKALLPEATAYAAPFDLVTRRGARETRVLATMVADLLAERTAAA
ncbi:LysR family transcriptional regulator [Caenispirillum bisanense]|uniref:LysR family transcriptional regulator n=1 Tax=Caenispirillum bisanense TaxID=414052 RepID=UPI0031CF327A